MGTPSPEIVIFRRGFGAGISLAQNCVSSVEASFSFFYFSTFIYFGDRERQSMNGGGAEREGDTESETGSRL